VLQTLEFKEILGKSIYGTTSITRTTKFVTKLVTNLSVTPPGPNYNVYLLALSSLWMDVSLQTSIQDSFSLFEFGLKAEETRPELNPRTFLKFYGKNVKIDRNYMIEWLFIILLYAIGI
jgi:hypothetical protein